MKAESNPDLTERLGASWDDVHETRKLRITRMREQQASMGEEADRVRGLRAIFDEEVKPVAKAWRSTMKEAAQVPEATTNLGHELRRARRSRPSRHWAGLLVRGRLMTMRLTQIALSLGKVLLVVLFVVVVIYMLLEWLGGMF